MVIDMLVHPMLYGEICTPGDEPDGFGFWSREFGMGHMGPMDWDELQVEMDVCDVQKSVLMPLDVTTACGGHFGTNDQIAMLVAAHPDRLWGFASVDPQVSGAADQWSAPLPSWGQGALPASGKAGFCPMMLWPSRFTSCAERYNKPVVFHAGMSWEPGAELSRSNPLAFEHTIATHPNVRFSLTHFGWPRVRETVAMLLKYPNCYADTSITYIDSPEEMMQRLSRSIWGRCGMSARYRTK
ncbi:MAG: amidohydrolase family protein [Collinsella aerofaciens]